MSVLHFSICTKIIIPGYQHPRNSPNIIRKTLSNIDFKSPIITYLKEKNYRGTWLVKVGVTEEFWVIQAELKVAEQSKLSERTLTFFVSLISVCAVIIKLAKKSFIWKKNEIFNCFFSNYTLTKLKVWDVETIRVKKLDSFKFTLYCL